MMTVGAFDAKNTLGSLLDRVEQGEVILITRHGKPVARLVPNEIAADSQAAHAAAERILQRAKSAGFGKFNWSEIKKDRDKGRA